MEDFDISHMSDMDEDDFLPKPPTATTITKAPPQSKPLTEKYNSRDPASASSSKFTDAFSDLKKSEFYKEPELANPSTSSSKPAALIGHPVAPGVQKVGKTGSLLVSTRQRGNPLLRSITSVRWEFEDDLVPDYVLGSSTCALFLSLRYHSLNPDYIHTRLKVLGSKYLLRILLLQVDQADPGHVVKQVNRLCLLAGMTLMLAASPEEAGKMLETYKMFENKPPDLIMERKEDGLHAKVENALTSVRCVNKTDASTLLRTFGSMSRVVTASESDLELVPGFGAHKARTLHRILHQPFLRH